MEPIKTDWFPGTVKPARPGVYQRDLPWPGDEFSKWDGEVWMDSHHTLEVAEQRTSRSAFQDRPWRGVVPEVLGCVPVDERERYTCQGCAFNLSDGRATRITRECIDAGLAAGTCIAQRIIWRPRSEVSNG